MCACHTRVVYSICRYLYRRSSHLVHASMGAQSFAPSYSNYTSVMKNCKSVPDSATCKDSDDTFFMILARKLNLPIWIFEMWTHIVVFTLFLVLCPVCLAAPGRDQAGGGTSYEYLLAK